MHIGDEMEIKEEDYQKAVAVVRKSLSGSVSNIQRKLYWGYCRAASAVDRMQNEFIVSPMSASGRREVYPEEMHELWKELQEAKNQTTPEGFVLVPKVLPSEINDQVWDDYLTPQCVVNEDGFSFISCEDFDLDALYQTLLKAQEQSHELD